MQDTDVASVDNGIDQPPTKDCPLECPSAPLDLPNGADTPSANHHVNGGNSEVLHDTEDEGEGDATPVDGTDLALSMQTPVSMPHAAPVAMPGHAAPVAMQGQAATQAQPMPPIQADGQPTSIQSDPQQSAFRPAMPGGQIYPGMENSPTSGMDFQYRNGMGQQQGAPWQEMPQEMSGYGPPQPMMGMNQPPHHMQSHHMPQPMPRRPITGNVTNYPQPPYQGMTRPGGPFPPSPGPHQNQFMQKQNYGGGGWGSPSWSGSGPPPAPPPMSMTPPPLNWNQGGARRGGSMGSQGPPMPSSRNKPFGNVPYTQGHQSSGHYMQNKTRSKNYPFPSKPHNSGDDVYGSGRLEGGGSGGPLDTMRTLEHYLPDTGSRQNYNDQGVKGGKSPSLIPGMGDDPGEEGNYPGADGSSSGFYGSTRSSPRSHASQSYEPGINERFSRKVFVGGLPPDIDEDEITASFRRFGPLVVDWPHKAESKSYFPPKGYAFLLFQDESSVQQLIEQCIQDEDKLYLCVSSPTIKDKPVQIRPWKLSDADFVLDATLPLDPRKTVFVGGVPRPLKAVELAMIMDRLYGGVCYAGIDTDPELKYPKGAGRVAFSNQQSYIAAISARFVQLQHGEIDKRVEVKPYVLDDQLCDECQGARCGGKFAPFFCANVTCLQYYCEQCWASIHSRPGREFHKPLVKEGADRPRAVPFRWC